jgi:mannose-6-phosphate isomerase-like protein (cupin superfamily)
MQRHQKRHELWLFLSGDGIMVNRQPPQAGDYMMIQCGDWHKYTALKPTWVLEVQCGETCDESDIERA